MSKGLEKVQKKIIKKKGKNSALHENSRDAQRLRRAQGRDDKLEKMALARRKIDRPLLVERAKYFQNSTMISDGRSLKMEEIHTLIKRFLEQYAEQLSQLKKERRPGRPSSAREDLIRIKVAAGEKEYKDGFYMPDLTDENNIVFLKKWEGSWSYLSTLKWVRVSSSGKLQTSRFPPKGDSSWKLPRSHISFSTSTTKSSKTKGKHGDDELITKLSSELQFENEMKEDISLPTSIKDYLENSPFDIIDEPGKEEVILTRTYGQEKIQITFSISDINMDPDADMSDRAFGAEEEEEGEANTEEQKNPDEGSEEDDISLPVRLHIVVEKPGKGALVIDSVIQDSMVMIESCLHYENTEHAYAKTSERFHERQDLYAGPVFANLDEELQVLFERYLDERGINTALAIFVPEYINMKEQKEYARWLKNVKEFVEA
ncbi:hypothetical protein EPUL_001505 [Erysiphe pulchra]|uniref:Mitochondrial glyco protein n=1 Tax=Erysiphe pulchra TaxID=225359 RepID=A0A2S4PXQ6_9PEZI|nr:hypothetical protein EPUL_001505 [Erysiphe pulchra]